MNLPASRGIFLIRCLPTEVCKPGGKLCFRAWFFFFFFFLTRSSPRELFRTRVRIVSRGDFRFIPYHCETYVFYKRSKTSDEFTRMFFRIDVFRSSERRILSRMTLIDIRTHSFYTKTKIFTFISILRRLHFMWKRIRLGKILFFFFSKLSRCARTLNLQCTWGSQQCVSSSRTSYYCTIFLFFFQKITTALSLQ